MSVKRILEEDWGDYDNKKIRDKRDSKDFACTELWEVDYLVKKIINHHPRKKEFDIKLAIEACCRELRSPHPRKAFVECVARKLAIPLI